MDDSKFVIIGSNGQLGTALREKYPQARAVDAAELDITDRTAVEAFDWTGVTHILNAAAYTNVDGAETPEGRVAAWKVNALAMQNIAHIAWQHDIVVVHISTDYVFDGSYENHKEDEPFSPLSVYGTSKAAGDLLIGQLNKHYILRTSWVIGEGKNFVRTMLELGKKGINPSVVSDQVGRLTFTIELVRAVDHLLVSKAPFGTYNVTGGGESISWAGITREIFKLAGLDNTVTDVTTQHYYEGKAGIAPRPLKSTLDLSKLQATGFEPRDWHDNLKDYIAKEQAQ